MNRCGGILLLMFALSATGCVIVDVGVTNPNPNISTVAIAPFFNQSNEKMADGRRVASAYFTELQKTPGYQVVPVGVTETAIIKHNLKMGSPQDVLKLAEILNVDAVVVGTITDYDPYYPPRIGMHVEWYSPYPVTFQPGIQVDPTTRKQIRHSIKYEDSDPLFHRRRRKLFSKIPLILRGQSPALSGEEKRYRDFNGYTEGIQLAGVIEEPNDGLIRPTNTSFRSYRTPSPVGATALQWYDYSNTSATGNKQTDYLLQPVEEAQPEKNNQSSEQDSIEKPPAKQNLFSKIRLIDFIGKDSPSSTSFKAVQRTDKPLQVAMNPLVVTRRVETVIEPMPLKPIMSYTRMFDGSDADLTATLRNYLELNGDARSGNWEATMQRSEDFIRFTCHLMIREMLTLHGGEARRRFVLKYRKYK